MSCILRNKGSSKKKSFTVKSYEVTKKISKAGKVLVTTVQRMNLKMLYTQVCYDLYQMMTSKIKGVF